MSGVEWRFYFLFESIVACCNITYFEPFALSTISLIGAACSKKNNCGD